MNTERPENDDDTAAAREPERAESETAPGSGSDTAPGSAEGSAGADTEETGAEDATADKTRVESAAAEKPEAGDTAADKPEAEEVEAEKAPVKSAAAEKPEAEDSAVADAGDGEDSGEVGEADVTPGAAPSAPRRRSPLLVASVAAAVLLVGGGGAYLTAQATGGSGGSGAPSGDGTPPALSLDDYAGKATDDGTPGDTAGIAPGEPNPYGVTYVADGDLPDGPGTAPVYWATGSVGKDEVARLAKALGVAGTPTADGDAWKVGSGNDGSGPVLRVRREAPGSWTFSRYAPGTDNCTGSLAKCTKDPAAPATAPVSEAAAKKAAAPVLKAVGQEDAELDASQVMGSQRIVNADPAIDGLPSYGWTTGVTVSAQGEVVGADGQLGAPVKGATYPLLSADEALAAMNAAPGTEHRMGIGGCASPVPLKDRLESPCGTATDPAATKRETVTVEDAVLGLAPHTSGGRQVLVPTWLFDVKARGAADGYRLTHPAVEPAYLESASASKPSPAPSATPGEDRRDVRVDGYTAEGDELVVSFTGGVCGDYAATAVESGGQVKVTVTETPWKDKVCIMIAKEFHQSVKLDEPLGDRKVVGSDGAAIPLEKPGARLPR
ncbi:hypothetical protein [Streptomyces sp. Amel2xC10]|uniref:hypothetical protein n=1 Tax=Streptomyces sp. Amel2xC10 TaxID=1305826 RepID=UPI000A086911|nr:hypothetical protein [Streptomyces sp. Amel2xC10]SMF31891.1 hypothetical protein SAMN02745830_02857 [Streptomyces sp. Amel2xC10]